ncbi:MAG: hypothetical protein Kow0026_16510 [Oricola sp.]
MIELFKDTILSYRTEIASIIIPLLVATIKYYTSPSSRIVYSKSHGFCYKVNIESPFLVYTETIFFQNIGRRKCSEFEIVLAYKPDNYSVFPDRDYRVSENPEGRFIIKTSGLARNESLTLNMLQSNIEPPHITNIIPSEGSARQITMAPMRVFPRPFYIFFAGVIVIGVISTLYGILRLLEFII